MHWWRHMCQCEKNIEIPFHSNLRDIHFHGYLGILPPSSMRYWIWIWTQDFKLQVSYLEPRGWPTVTADSDHYFHMWCLYARPSVPLFKLSQNNSKSRTVITTGSGRGDHWWHMSCTQEITQEIYKKIYTQNQDNSNNKVLNRLMPIISCSQHR